MVNIFRKVKDKVTSSEDGQPNYFIPGALVTLLFFLWGFSYGLLDTLNKHFRNVLGISKLIKVI
jgi:FHS family L-fucose permease-like MFS transporter